VEGNVFENNWIAADQQGFAILFSTRNQSGGAPWSTIENVTFQYNEIRNSLAGMKFLVTDDTYVSDQMRDVVVRNNLLININANAAPTGTSAGDRAGRLFQVMNPSTAPGPVNLTIDHNTAFSTREVSFSVWEATLGVTFTNNVVRHNQCSTGSNACGISGDSTAPGFATLLEYFTSASAPRIADCATLSSASIYDVAVCGNIFAGGGRPSDYPPGNDFPASVSFASTTIDPITGLAPADADYTVANGTKGVDWITLQRYITAATSGAPLQ
jgi:hypothetical protein